MSQRIIEKLSAAEAAELARLDPTQLAALLNDRGALVAAPPPAEAAAADAAHAAAIAEGQRMADVARREREMNALAFT